MVDWASENVPFDSSPFILEVGAGNGNLLFSLCEAGYNPHKILGVDYSPDAIKLAQAIAKNKSTALADEVEDEGEGAAPALEDADKITFAVCDFLQDDVVPLESMAAEAGLVAVWDLVLDKGTFDAIALAEKDASGGAPADGYPARIGRVVKQGGFFLITCESDVSRGCFVGRLTRPLLCSMQLHRGGAESEIRQRHYGTAVPVCLRVLETIRMLIVCCSSRIPWPTFSFGGHSGNVYSSMAFHKP